MLTTNQLRAEFVNAILNDVTMQGLIGGRLYWIGKQTTELTFPLLNYRFFDDIGEYTLGNNEDASEITMQIDAYTDSGDVTNMDAITEQLKVILNAIGYRRISSPIELVDSDINKIVRPSRWERWNV